MSIARTQSRALTALAAALFFASTAGAEPVGFVAVAEGDVDIRSAGTTSFAAAAMDREVEIGDTIRTGRDSIAKILLVDDTTLTIDEETELEIDHYVVGPAATTEPSRINLVAGQVRTKVGEAFGGETRLQVHTPTAVIGVKGTEWITMYLAAMETTWVCVISGRVSVEHQDPAVGGFYEPPVGKCARVLKHIRPEPAEFPPGMSAASIPRASLAPVPRTVLDINAPVGSGPGDVDPLNIDTPGGPGGGGGQEQIIQSGDAPFSQTDVDPQMLIMDDMNGGPPPMDPEPEDPDGSGPGFGSGDTSGGGGFGTGDTTGGGFGTGDTQP